jgi:hypothetical protein
MIYLATKYKLKYNEAKKLQIENFTIMIFLKNTDSLCRSKPFLPQGLRDKPQSGRENWSFLWEIKIKIYWYIKNIILTARPPGQAPKGPGKLKFSLGNLL